MPTTIGMYEKGYDLVGERLMALGLDVVVHTFDKDGRFLVEGERVAPDAVDLDYLWLNQSITSDGVMEPVFDAMLTCRSLKVMQTFNAGLDHAFYKHMSARGIRICNSSAQGVAIAEYTMAQVLSAVHPIEEQRRMQAARQWKITPFRELSQMRWLIVGFGPIGREIAKRLKAFGSKVTVVRRTPDASDLADAVGTSADLPRLLPEADVVVIACPLNAETRGMADAGFFAAMKEGAILVNIARGGLVEDAALLAALDKNRPALAILDVFHEEPLPSGNPFWSHPKVRMTSHTSFAGSGVRDRWHQLFLDNIQRFVKGRPLLNEVDPRSFG
ncbi:MAG: D-2-hydroxyacid dehydrogenase [Hyphomicrobiaceae bacterium]